MRLIPADMARHAGEFLRALRSHKYERTEAGLFFPAAKVTAQGTYFENVNGEDEREHKNLLTDQGLTHMLAVVLGGTSKINAWYLAPYSNSVNPAAGWTASNFPSTAGEITSSVEGYTETTRPAFTPGAAAANTIDNVASKAAFTIATASTLSIAGAALLSSNVKGDTGGTLISATRFGTARILNNGDIWNCGYRVQLSST